MAVVDDKFYYQKYCEINLFYKKKNMGNLTACIIQFVFYNMLLMPVKRVNVDMLTCIMLIFPGLKKREIYGHRKESLNRY